jgi:hypothetical protein
VGFGELNDNAVKGLTGLLRVEQGIDGLLSVEQEIEFIAYT